MENKEENVKQEKKSFSDKPYEITTLFDLGPNLPVIPTREDGAFIKDRSFSFIEWDMDIEEKIAAIWNDENNVGIMINKMMGILLDQLAGEDFKSFSDDQKTAKLNQVDFANMMYMYMFLRTEELGYELKMEISCPSCFKLMKNFKADLKTLEIHQKNEEHERLKRYDLAKPIHIDKDIITTIWVNHSKWYTMEKADISVVQNAGKMKKLLFETSIEKVSTSKPDNTKFFDIKTIIKKLKKIDIEKISELITDNSGGPLMAMEGKCSHCKRPFYKAIDWSYQYFFDSSSL